MTEFAIPLVTGQAACQSAEVAGRVPDWTWPLEVEPAEVLHHVPPYLHA
jgi:hypothetical protein